MSSTIANLHCHPDWILNYLEDTPRAMSSRFKRGHRIPYGRGKTWDILGSHGHLWLRCYHGNTSQASPEDLRRQWGVLPEPLNQRKTLFNQPVIFRLRRAVRISSLPPCLLLCHQLSSLMASPPQDAVQSTVRALLLEMNGSTFSVTDSN